MTFDEFFDSIKIETSKIETLAPKHYRLAIEVSEKHFQPFVKTKTLDDSEIVTEYKKAVREDVFSVIKLNQEDFMIFDNFFNLYITATANLILGKRKV